MAKSQVYKRGVHAGEVGFNMTPMIDCTFQLIIFFILASQAASSELSMLFLPDPTMSQAMPEKENKPKNRVVINVVSKGDSKDRSLSSPEGSEAARYEVLGNDFALDQFDKLVNEISKRKKEAPPNEPFFVVIRADYRVNYGYVKTAMQAAAEAQVSRMNITALQETAE